MILFLDTTNKDLVIALFDKNKKLIQKNIVENLKQKAEILPKKIQEILNDNKISINEISDFYLNLGPGSFTGVRIGLVYLRTICQINNNINLHTTTTFQIIYPHTNNQIKNIYIDAKSKMCYFASVSNGLLTQPITLKTCEEPINEITIENYNYLFNNFDKYSKLIFEKVDDLLKVEALYIKKPHIGM